MDTSQVSECGGGGDPVAVWDRENAMVNQALLSLPFAIGAYAIAKHRPRKLPLYLAAVTVFVTYWRRFICARCQYYGTECSTMLGIMTARIMPRDESAPLTRNAMIADFSFIGALALIPLRQVLKGKRLAVLYVLALGGGFASVMARACGRCGNDFCPMKEVRARLMG